MNPRRDDLLALDQRALEDLGNRGLYKRASRDLERGLGPTIEIDADGTVRASSDEAVTTLGPGVGLAATTCSCGSMAMCRHRIGAVLAYQQSVDDDGERDPSGEIVEWSPGAFTDDDLVARFGSAVVAAARRTLRRGAVVTIVRPGPQDPVPTAELDSCTVRFLVPDDLAYTSTSARGHAGDEFVVLAVWAFREADERALEGERVTMDLGGVATGDAATASLARAIDFVDRLLIEGAAHLGDHRLTSEAAARGLGDDGMRWPLAVVEELQDQLDDYAGRGTRYSATTCADLVAELQARARAAATTAAIPRGTILGTNEAAEAPLRHARLDGLGCRISGTLDDRLVEIFLAHADTGAVYVLRRRIAFDNATPPSPERFLERVMAARATIRSLAHGNLVTGSAMRRANREIRVARSTIGQTSVTPSTARWEQLPTPLRVGRFADLARRLADRPPRLVDARVLAGSVHVLPVGAVADIGWRPGTQTLAALIEDDEGRLARLELQHRDVAPGAIDALHRALLDPSLRFVSGACRLVDELVVVEPFAAATDRLIAFDATPPDADPARLPVGRVPAASGGPAEPLRQALDVLETVPHSGLRNLPSSFAMRIESAASDLQAGGLVTSAGRLREFGDALARWQADGDARDALTTWTDARIRLLVAAETAGTR